MTDRSLAHIEKIEWVRPIEGADNIELIGVLGWVCIAKKEEFEPGDLAVYIEIDSKCPESDERFAFLAAKHYKVKTMKLGKFKVVTMPPVAAQMMMKAVDFLLLVPYPSDLLYPYSGDTSTLQSTL